jgi:hypothetical protein
VTPTDVDHFYREVARAALTVAGRYGFVLGGGVAWVVSGLVRRPTEDIDLFSDTDGAAAAAAGEVRAALLAAGFDVEEEQVDTQLGELFYGFDLDQKEFLVSDGERAVRLSLCRLDRHHRPVVMDIGPVMSVEDLVATKVAALVNRREVRDYIDVAAALHRYSIDELLDLAHRPTSSRPAASWTGSTTTGSPTTACLTNRSRPYAGRWPLGRVGEFEPGWQRRRSARG